MDARLRGATVVDGTGAPGRVADVVVRGGRVASVGAGRDDGADLPVLDLSGLVLAPGFVDPHTHYDAQVLWDGDLTPSCWHGVTTVVMGNCGFTLAPTRAEHRELVLLTLEHVEGMPLDALRAGIPWGFETYPDYLDLLDATPKRLNVASMIGHTALRYYVLGPDAADRAATPDEVTRMRALLAEALAAGAVGLSTSKSPTHTGAHHKPVPSRAAALAEIGALVDVLGEQRAGVLQATWGPELYVEEFAELAARSGRTVTWAAIMAQREHPEWASAAVSRTAALGGDVVPQIACRPVVLQLLAAEPMPLARMPAFAELLELPVADRPARYADPDWRERARAQLAADPLWAGRLDAAVVAETGVHADLVEGPTLGALAAERGGTPFDVLVDLALADGLATRFRVLLTNDDEEQVAALLTDKRLLLGLSDAGAHTSQLCDANAPTYLLGHWWRERGVLSLEDAVWRLTGHPATVFGLAGRGVLAPGAVADLVAFDPDRVGTGPLERVRDLPGGADRLVARSTGIEHVWVAGEPVRTGGADVQDARPGALLRHGRG